MEFLLTRSTRVSAQWHSAPVEAALRRFRRDMQMTLRRDSSGPANEITVCLSGTLPPEGYTIDLQPTGQLVICASDDLGAVYALLELSRVVLGVTPFWFWNDQHFTPQYAYLLSEPHIVGTPRPVRWRGWAVTDEVLLRRWATPDNQGWEMLFEALLRCGGNMVLPGSFPTEDALLAHCTALAAQMGLYIAQSPAAPLGAERFSALWPELEPNFAQYPAHYRTLWADAVQKQKATRTIWTLGVPAGDLPPWQGDEGCTTPEARAQRLTELILEQYDLVRAAVETAPVCTYLSGEAAELYRRGLVDLPDDVFLVWEGRAGALPPHGSAGHHGLRLPLTRREEVAGCLLTPQPAPTQIWASALYVAADRELTGYWLVDCGNLKPNVFAMDFAAALWQQADIMPDDHREAYLRTYFTAEDGWPLRMTVQEDLATCLKAWPESTVLWGQKPHQRGGDRFLNRSVRAFANAFLCGRTQTTVEEMAWMAGPRPFGEQLARFRTACVEALPKFETLYPGCNYAARSTGPLWKQAVLAPVECYLMLLRGAVTFCDAIALYFKSDYSECFCRLYTAATAFSAAAAALQRVSEGRWAAFYEGDCLSDCRRTAALLRQLLPLVRAAGEGPERLAWQRELLPDSAALPAPSLEDDALYELFRLRRRAQEAAQEAAQAAESLPADEASSPADVLTTV